MRETTRITKHDVWPMLAAIAFASVSKLSRYLPIWGAFLYLSCASALLALVRRRLEISTATWPSERQVRRWVAAMLLFLAVLFLIVHPLLEHRAAWHDGAGSDRDEALEKATLALVTSGRPYEIVLSTGNPISPMPGELILALPFVLLGVSGLQNIAWLGFYYGALSSTLRSSHLAAFGLFAMLLLAPGVVHEIVTAGDLLATSLAVATGCMWLMSQARSRSNSKWMFALSVLFGVVLSSRVTYLLIVPLVLAASMRMGGGRAAALVLAGTTIGFVSVTVPFVSYTSHTFGPFHIFEKVNLISGYPHASLFVIGVSSIHSALASWLILHTDARHLFPHAAYVLLTPVVLTVALCYFTLGIASITQFGWYALWCAPFAITGLALRAHIENCGGNGPRL